MAKMSMFFCFFLFVLIAVPAASSASSRMLLQSNRCPIVPRSSRSSLCGRVVCVRQVFCTLNVLICPDGQYAFKPCCGCERCCPL
ncbi:hypothetical protein C5167_014754 [Papaver somniferum]|uniref:Uncharacterized protein n=1 Tax=Papaver somniferum TaxID=3469 RepID=A0A4Y7J796_PAPSO|nr:hypothetical protein C5167_014753 [Papaver somniferum]RZC55920.1 hypothetical protein C5167_014754 [Papaver somniferum]